jgi:hypothetical protein
MTGPRTRIAFDSVVDSREALVQNAADRKRTALVASDERSKTLRERMIRVGICMVVVTLVACGGEDETAKHDSLTVIADTPEVVVSSGGSGTVEILLQRTGSATDAVATLTIAGVPDGVTATFDVATTTGNFATLTIAAGTGAAQGTRRLTVTASTGAITGSAAVSLTVQAPGHITTH